MRRAHKGGFVALAAIVAALGAASAWAATYHGDARANTIHGSPGADVIYGRGGNDKLYGLAGNDKLYGGAGNDLLVGGPGRDLLDCGPGRDTAVTDGHDQLIGCEVVKGPKPVAPPPPTTTTTTTTAAPTPEAGQYCGFTNNGGSICFDIGGQPLAFGNAQYDTSFDSNDCDPPANGSVHWTTTGTAPLQADGSFTFHVDSGDSAGSTLSGVVDTSGGATGALHVHTVISSGGTTYTCTLNATWTTTKQ